MDSFINPATGKYIYARGKLAKSLLKNKLVSPRVLKDTIYLWNPETQLIVEKKKFLDMRFNTPILREKFRTEYIVDSQNYTIKQILKKDFTYSNIGMDSYINSEFVGEPVQYKGNEVMSSILDTVSHIITRFNTAYKKDITVRVFYRVFIEDIENKNTGDAEILTDSYGRDYMLKSKTFNIDNESSLSKTVFKSDFKEWLQLLAPIVSSASAEYDVIKFFAVKLGEGGCVTGKKETVNFKIDGMTIYNQPSKGNNCFFMCIMEELNKIYPNKQNSKIIELLRNKYNLGYNSLVNTDQAIEIYNKETGKNLLIINDEMEPINTIASSSKNIGCSIMLKDNHFLKVVYEGNRKHYNICDKCGIVFYKKHSEKKCKNRIDWMMPISEKKSRFVKVNEFVKRTNNNINVLHYDIETRYNTPNKAHIPYIVACAYYTIDKNIVYKYWAGDECMKDFTLFLLNSGEINHITHVNAYNGSNFDHRYVLREYVKLGNEIDTVLANGSFIDSVLKRTPIKLTEEEVLVKINKKIKKAYQIANSKGKSPSTETLKEIREKIIKKANSEEHFKTTKIHLWDLYRHSCGKLKNQLEAWNCNIIKGDIDHSLSVRWEETDEERRNECLKYLECDVLGLLELYDKQNNYYNEKYGINLTDYITTSQATYDYWRRDIEENSIYLPTYEEDCFIRKSAYGGRTYPNKKSFVSSQYEKIINKEISYDNITDCIFDLDVVSLYPTAMLEYYPVGEPIKTDIFIDNKLGIYNAKMLPNKKLAYNLWIGATIP